jgi:sugar phosphate isomerase/epimerase
MPNIPIDTATAYCADLGFDGLELTVMPGWTTDAALLDRHARRHVRDLYDSHNLELCGFSGHIALLGDNGAPVAASLDRFRMYLDFASELQRPGERLSVCSTSSGSPGDWDAVKCELVERFGLLSEYADTIGVVVAAEPHVHAALHLPDQALWLVDQIRSPGFRIHFDISHFNVQGLDMDQVVAQLAPVSAHTHVKDERGVEPDFEFLIPGEGDMDYVRYLRAMANAAYEGHITVEISQRVQRRTGYDPFVAAARSYRVLADAFEAAGVSRPKH